MPHLPKWMVDTMESLLPSKFFDAEVMTAVFINPEILKVRFKADLQNMEFYPGWAVVLRAGTNDLRHYTISSFSREKGLFDIIFHIHGGGPGSDLAVNLKTNDNLKIAVPGGRKMYVPKQTHHFFFGDETSLSFIVILINEIRKNGENYQGIVELRMKNNQIPDKLNLDIDTVLSTSKRPGLQAIQHFKKLQNEPGFSFENYVFYLTGNVASIQAFRKELKKIGANSKNIKLQGYWAEGSVGL